MAKDAMRELQAAVGELASAGSSSMPPGADKLEVGGLRRAAAQRAKQAKERAWRGRGRDCERGGGGGGGKGLAGSRFGRMVSDVALSSYQMAAENQGGAFASMRKEINDLKTERVSYNC
jgi:hypothetical protein